MKNTLMRNVLRSAAFLLLLALLLQGTARLLQPRNNTQEAGMELQRLRGILAEPEDSIDVLFFGDSEAYSGYSPPGDVEYPGLHLLYLRHQQMLSG